MYSILTVFVLFTDGDTTATTYETLTEECEIIASVVEEVTLGQLSGVDYIVSTCEVAGTNM